MSTLTGKTPRDTYKDLLQVSNANSGVDGTLRPVEDGEGTPSALRISAAAVDVAGTFSVGGEPLAGSAISGLYADLSGLPSAPLDVSGVDRAALTQSLRTALESAAADARLTLHPAGTTFQVNGALFTSKGLALDGNGCTLLFNSQVTDLPVTVGSSGGSLTLLFAADHGLSAADKILVDARDPVDPDVDGTWPGNTQFGGVYYPLIQSSRLIKLSTTQNGSAIAYASAGSGTITAFRPVKPALYADAAYQPGSYAFPATNSSTLTARYRGVFDVIDYSRAVIAVGGVNSGFDLLTIAGTAAFDAIGLREDVKLTAEDPIVAGSPQSTGRATIASVDPATGIITTSGAHGYSTGNRIWWWANLQSVMPMATVSKSFAAEPFSVTSGSPVATVTLAAHGLEANQQFTLSGAADVGGIAAATYLNATLTVGTVLDASTFTVRLGAGATSTATGGGAAVAMTAAQVRRYRNYFFRSLSATTGALYPTLADAQADTNRVALAGAITGTNYLNRGAYRSGDVTRVHRKQIVNGNTVLTVNRSSERLTDAPRLVLYKDNTLVVKDLSFDYVPHQWYGCAFATGGYPDAPNGNNFGPVMVFAFREAYLEGRCTFNHTPGPGFWVVGAFYARSDITNGQNGINQGSSAHPDGDFANGSYPVAGVSYHVCMTSTAAFHFQGGWVRDTRHGCTSNPAWQYEGADPMFHGRNKFVKVSGLFCSGHAKDSAVDSHQADGDWDVECFVANCGGNAVNARSNMRIRGEFRDCERIGQFTGPGPDAPIRVDLDIRAKNCGVLQATGDCVVTVNGVIDGQVEGSATAPLVETTGSGAWIKLGKVDIYTKDVAGSVVYCHDGGRIDGCAETTIQPAVGVTLTQAVRAIDFKKGGGCSGYFDNTQVLGANWYLAPVVESASGASSALGGVVHVDASYAEATLGGGLFMQRMLAGAQPDRQAALRVPPAAAGFNATAVSVANNAFEVVLSSNGSTPRIFQNLTGGMLGQRVLIRFGSGFANYVFDFANTTGTSQIRGNGGVNWTPAANDALMATLDGTGIWRCSIIACG